MDHIFIPPTKKKKKEYIKPHNTKWQKKIKAK